METIKAYTDLEQSKKLAKILALESADMYYPNRIDIKYQSALPIEYKHGNPLLSQEIAAWSLAALLEQLHYEVCDDDGYSTYLQINKDDDMYQLEYIDPSEIFESIETDRYKHFVDACVAMVEKLHKLNLL